jgi:hypothetical protein
MKRHKSTLAAIVCRAVLILLFAAAISGCGGGGGSPTGQDISSDWDTNASNIDDN